jgi:serine/threonine-protein kinase
MRLRLPSEGEAKGAFPGMANHAVSPDAIVGQRLGHYRIAEKIGAGGMGQVYRAQDEHLDREVAIKVLRPGTLADEHARKRFRKEALALSKLNHPNVATIHDFDRQRGLDFLVLEYIPGITLSAKVAGRPLPEKEVVNLGIQLAEGLSAAHERGVVHRDLKPGNLRLTDDRRLKILDFGLAKLRPPATPIATTESLTETRTIVGTLPYMAPEQLLGGEIDARTDIHAAGSVLYEMAAGKNPFAEVERSQLIGAILHRAPQPLSSRNRKMCPELERIIGKCLEKEPENRYQSAKELVIDLRRLSAPSAMEAAILARPLLIWRRLPTIAVLGTIILAAIFGLIFSGRRARMLATRPLTKVQSLAVLPFENLSGDPGQEYFTEGMAEALITNLSQISALRVISRTSAMRYKDTKKTLPEIARELDLDAVVTGSVQRSGERVRITAQLIHARTDTDLWAGSYDRKMQDVLELESSVARTIADEIQVKLTPQEKARLIRARQVNPEAYEAYLRGRYEWNKRTAEGLRRGADLFQQALAKDPGYAAAYAGLADSYFSLAYSADVLRPREGVPKAKAAAVKALEIDESLAEAHATLGAIKLFYDWDWKAAEQELKRAIALNPGYATAHHWYGLCLGWTGRVPEARAELQRAHQLDPLSSIISTNLAWTFSLTHDYDRAIEQLRQTLEVDPNFWLAYWDLGGYKLALGRYSEAVSDLQKAVEFSRGSTGALGMLGYAYGVTGDRAKAQQVLQKLKKMAQSRYVSPADLAVVEFGLGNKDQGFARLEEAYQDHSGFLATLRTEPLLDRWRSDPRFVDLLHRVKLSD